MSKVISGLLFIGFVLLLSAVPAYGQGALQQQPVKITRDPGLELDAKHNLDVAKFYFKRKAYKGVADRLNEILYVYPEFSKADEVLSLLAEAYLKLDNKNDAAKTFKRIVDEYPDSLFVEEARKKLSTLPPPTDSPSETKKD
ncbi:MAG: outer membrane protein assembly factor BamD [Blastocatellia bacterium]|nr:outer membrane protein assembly factor BamD [Blastocatellia bacterium]